ncbi:MAG TPA: 50S ribosomal protein L19 [Patescibacteria group bacterium]|nr:50S ribosomal protein L19 [Patescibacteria group bacterium]
MDDKSALQIREKQHIRVFQKFVEGKRERNVPFVGIVRKVRGSGVNRTITVAQMLEGIEVEKIFPTALPTITKIEIIEDKPKASNKSAKKSRKAAKKK